MKKIEKDIGMFLIILKEIAKLCVALEPSKAGFSLQISSTGTSLIGKQSEEFFFYLGFFPQTFTIHRTAGEGGGYRFLDF